MDWAFARPIREPISFAVIILWFNEVNLYKRYFDYYSVYSTFNPFSISYFSLSLFENQRMARQASAYSFFSGQGAFYVRDSPPRQPCNKTCDV